MARTLVRASDTLLYNTSVPARGSAWSAACWISGWASATGLQPIFADYGSSSNWVLRVEPSNSLYYTVWSSGDFDCSHTMTSALTHVAITISGNTVTSYINGSQTATGSLTAATYGTGFVLGGLHEGGGMWDHELNGTMSWVGLWDAQLTAAEIAALADGFHPSMIRPASLVSAWDLYGNNSPEPGAKGYAMTLVNSPAKAAQPRQYLRSRWKARRFTTASVGGGSDVLQRKLSVIQYGEVASPWGIQPIGAGV